MLWNIKYNSRVSAVCCCCTFSFALQAKEVKNGFAVRGPSAWQLWEQYWLMSFILVTLCSSANKWNSTLSWEHKFLNMVFIKHITSGHLTSLTIYKALVKWLKMLRFCFSICHILGSFSCYCSISVTALVPPKSQCL